MDHAWIRVNAHMKAAVFEQLQHWRVLRQHLRYELTNPCVFRNRDKVSKQQRANASALVRIDDHEGDLRLIASNKHVTATSSDR